ncbi:TetR/AcrR family transcriptional regulator [Actinomadura macrotermitis]|uniref:HTH tetR-type domain-containing protein n=1 Tax=Actinomadura macrotermitis TaxID=2585200 RepID=A0A7K0BUW2_9ACTN|nr:TetR/AcrR family transcriptional regulator [Actinomadura macrotermitis]MQY04933.1 hypothetical protein [Actinomadura macrotermitis]
METRVKLLEGALEVLRTRGIAGASARVIAAAAGVNQALVFYHFGTVDDLLVAALGHGAESRVARYRERFAGIDSIGGLVELGRAVREEEQAAGNFTVLAQLLAGGQANPKLAEATAAGLALWTREVEAVLARVLAGTPLAEFVHVGGLARALASSFIGLELYAGVDADAARQATGALDELAMLMSVLDDLGPVVRRAVRARLRRTAR